MEIIENESIGNEHKASTNTLEYWRKMSLELYRECVGSRYEPNWRTLLEDARRDLVACGLLSVGENEPEQDATLSLNKVYVSNFPWDTKEDDIKGFFAKHGEVKSVYIVMDKETGRSRGFAFVEFADSTAVESALSDDGVDFHGRTLKVGKAMNRTSRSRRNGENGRGYRRGRGGYQQSGRSLE